MTAKQQADREPFNLPTNYRSTPELIAALNQLFDHPQPFAQPDLRYPAVGAADKPRASLRLAEEGEAAPLSLVWLGDDPLGKVRPRSWRGDTARRIAVQLGRRGTRRFRQGRRLPRSGRRYRRAGGQPSPAGMIADELARVACPAYAAGATASGAAKKPANSPRCLPPMPSRDARVCCGMPWRRACWAAAPPISPAAG